MSDTVKLIIEIPKVPKNDHERWVLSHGTPLDDVKTEMEKHQFSREYCCDHNIDTAIDMSMVRIILNNMGEESEEECR